MDRNISKTLLESGQRRGGGDKNSGRRLQKTVGMEAA
jgi:hypothetical protein